MTYQNSVFHFWRKLKKGIWKNHVNMSRVFSLFFQLNLLKNESGSFGNFRIFSIFQSEKNFGQQGVRANCSLIRSFSDIFSNFRQFPISSNFEVILLDFSCFCKFQPFLVSMARFRVYSTIFRFYRTTARLFIYWSAWKMSSWNRILPGLFDDFRRFSDVSGISLFFRWSIDFDPTICCKNRIFSGSFGNFRKFSDSYMIQRNSLFPIPFGIFSISSVLLENNWIQFLHDWTNFREF